MHKKLHLLPVVCFCLFFSYGNAQDELNFQAIKLDSSLTKDANAIVRSEEVVVELNSINSMIVKTKRVVTVLNKLGNRHADSYERYAPSVKIKKLEASVLNALGIEEKKYKKKDFKDRSAYDGFSLAVDDRIKYFEYTPTKYPYTLIFESEVESLSTAFIPSWFPISSSRLSVERSSFRIDNNTDIILRFKENNLENYPVEKSNEGTSVTYSVSNVSAIRQEAYSPSYYDLVPFLKVAPNQFTLESIEGTATDWKSFGKWLHNELISGRNQLAEETVAEITALLENVTTKKEKAKLIYEYVQKKTRYVSIQLGIGGWMPFPASDVDRLGYGDCKALTNYTKALLDSQKIPSYYTVVYGDENIRDIDENFASLQGNHVILNIPDKEEDIWLECTSQTTPFNFIAGFTDDRNALVLTPEGGEIKHTKKYTSEENNLFSLGSITISSDGSLEGSIEMRSGGIQYNQRYDIQSETEKDQKIYYKKYWNYINGLNIRNITHKDDKEKAIFMEKIDLNTPNYATKAGSRLLINPNVFNRYTNKLPKYENRKMPLAISRGYLDTDENTIVLPSGFSVQKIPAKKVIESEFGKYSWELEKISDTQLKFKRVLRVESGLHPKEKYEAYRQFMLDVRKADASKIIVKQL